MEARKARPDGHQQYLNGAQEDGRHYGKNQTQVEVDKVLAEGDAHILTQVDLVPASTVRENSERVSTAGQPLCSMIFFLGSSFQQKLGRTLTMQQDC